MDEVTFSSEANRIISGFATDFVNVINEAYTAHLGIVNDIPEDWLLKAGKEFKDSYLKGDYEECIKILAQLANKPFVQRLLFDTN